MVHILVMSKSVLIYQYQIQSRIRNRLTACRSCVIEQFPKIRLVRLPVPARSGDTGIQRIWQMQGEFTEQVSDDAYIRVVARSSTAEDKWRS